jgi:hypothetical protein
MYTVNHNYRLHNNTHMEHYIHSFPAIFHFDL